jgi:hypothetical protein
MQRRVFSREFKLEAVKLIKERGWLLPRRRGTWCGRQHRDGPQRRTQTVSKEDTASPQ